MVLSNVMRGLFLTPLLAVRVGYGAPEAAVVGAPEVPVAGLEAGELLLGELNCVACHKASAPITARLMPKPAPILGEVGARVSVRFLRAFLSSPLTEKPGITMPDLLHGLPDADRAEAVEALVQFLVSLAVPRPSTAVSPNPLSIAQGRLLYHQVGCVACHAPRESPGTLSLGLPESGSSDPDAAQFVLSKLDRISPPLGNLSAKYTAQTLAAFLEDPVKVRPGGRMPSLTLNSSEAMAIATYLTQPPVQAAKQGSSQPPQVATPLPGVAVPGPYSGNTGTFEPNPRSARQGRHLFGSLGCAACHRLGGSNPALTSRLEAKAFSELDPDAPTGCLSRQPAQGTPRFHLSEAQRTELKARLARQEDLRRPLAAADQVSRTLVRLNCYACHSRNGLGGPTPSRSDYFATWTDVDLGDEGRIPPHLTEVGNKLRPEWLREVLLNKGVVRPYMATRMPQYGVANVQHLVTELPKADAVGTRPAETRTTADARMGRLLVGVGGYSCISCHSFGGRKSLGISVMDMTWATRRLRNDWFRRYLLDPASLRPGTRMPAFWPDGKATLPGVLDGDTERQIQSIWSYLSQGKAAAAPPGL